MKLYSFFRSGTSHRLRIALNLKGLTPDYIPVDLRVDEQAQPSFKGVNPQGLVPALTLDDGETLIQSPAIIEWLEERFPDPALLPKEPEARAHVRALAAIIGCDVHPINNRRILQYLGKQLGADETQLNAWCSNWITAGFDAIEALLAKDNQRGAFCFGYAPTIADVYLIPQIESARRFKVDMANWPLISAVDQACSPLAAFSKAAPLVQPDA
ncbi:maleylacetoacetate isomerase [Diaphorobacter sp. HDW4A]|uniref:maleylacetoacetate isomerase n=1 Tax=Diaphorobacter sp. HDW4A TaxID=2714924 RepID=UPI0014080934|nr:maleylacetoacetate isomerase [Diaphorobacter sp. HDW4A]QIL79644.1 maleylacetoacetate isomerase [Diaphorobacter sp. HDW4A]